MTKKSRNRRVSLRAKQRQRRLLIGITNDEFLASLNDVRNAYVDSVPHQYDWPTTIEFRDKLDAFIKEAIETGSGTDSIVSGYQFNTFTPFEAGKIDCLVFGKRP